MVPKRGYVVRWDYYKELGYPPVNNEEDYLKVLRQMHENHPFTEDGYPTYRRSAVPAATGNVMLRAAFISASSLVS